MPSTYSKTRGLRIEQIRHVPSTTDHLALRPGRCVFSALQWLPFMYSLIHHPLFINPFCRHCLMIQKQSRCWKSTSTRNDPRLIFTDAPLTLAGTDSHLCDSQKCFPLSLTERDPQLTSRSACFSRYIMQRVYNSPAKVCLYLPVHSRVPREDNCLDPWWSNSTAHRWTQEMVFLNRIRSEYYGLWCFLYLPPWIIYQKAFSNSELHKCRMNY